MSNVAQLIVIASIDIALLYLSSILSRYAAMLYRRYKPSNGNKNGYFGQILSSAGMVIYFGCISLAFWMLYKNSKEVISDKWLFISLIAYSGLALSVISQGLKRVLMGKETNVFGISLDPIALIILVIGCFVGSFGDLKDVNGISLIVLGFLIANFAQFPDIVNDNDEIRGI